MPDLTTLLGNAAAGDGNALNHLYERVYAELRAIAANKMAAERQGHTLQPTALVNEAYLRMEASKGVKFENRAHFFAAAAEVMRRILIERARRRLAAKRGAGAEVIPLDDLELPSPASSDDQLLAMDDALQKFVELDPRKAELVKLRYFVGMSFEETAAALDIAVPTAKQWWAFARAWLAVEMRESAPL
jgi:RNA polymerase sigma factor (TIGR02999 family)